MRIFISRGDGTFAYAPELVEGEIMAHHAVVVTDDFNLDGRADLAVFDQGAYESAGAWGSGIRRSSSSAVPTACFGR